MAVQIPLETIKRMLDVCTPGYRWKVGTHRIAVILPDGRSYRGLPTGTKKSKGLIEAGHIRKLARYLGILECAKKQIPALTS